MKAAIIVAAPAAEILSAGGLILRNPDWDWTVLSLSHADDPDRRDRFARACERLGLTGLLSDLDDSDPPHPISPRREIGHRIMESLPPTCWDLCVTHGGAERGGPRRRREVHGEVRSLIWDGILRCRQLWTFGDDLSSAGATCPRPRERTSLALSQQELLEKERILREDYGYERDAPELRASLSPEVFTCWTTSEEE
jgi:hypothetical protein